MPPAISLPTPAPQANPQQAQMEEARNQEPWFTDAADLHPTVSVPDSEHVETVRSLYLQALEHGRPEEFLATFRSAPPAEQQRLRRSLGQVLDNSTVQHWVEAEPTRRHAAETIAVGVAPPDPGVALNGPAEARMAHITNWGRWPYQAIIVPGYSTDDGPARPGVHPIARERLQEAVHAWRTGHAPFIMVSGGAVHPAGTPYAEGVEMRQVLIEMGVPADAIIVEGRAQHTTTNLRNTGRYMLDHGMSRAEIITSGPSQVFGQDFYLGHPHLSTFHLRSRTELGYRVGELHQVTPDVGRSNTPIAFTPSPDVRRVQYHDLLDP